MQQREKKTEVKGKTKTRQWLPIRLLIPDIDLDAMVVQGIDGAALRRGPGHDPDSTFPGESGNCVIAAHRNMYGWWFYRLGRLGPNSIIQLRTPHETFIYKVALITTVAETETSILRAPRALRSAPRLTLYTCTLPRGSNRIIVVANLIEDKKIKAKASNKAL